MSRRRGRFWGGLALLLVVAALVFYVWATEPVRYMAPAAPDASVRGNPYLAAQTLLENWQRPTRRIFSTGALFPLPDTGTTLILDEYRGELGSGRIDALFDWVQRGGHLIVAARPAYHYVADETGDKDGNSERTGGNDDPLLTPLGLHAVAVETDSEDDPFTTLLDRFQPMESLFLEYCLGDNDGDLSPQCEALTCEAPPLPAPATWVFADGDRRQLLASPGQALQHRPTDLLPALPSVLFASSALLRTNEPLTQRPFSPFMKSSRMSERMPSSMISSFSLRYRWYSPGEWRYEWNETWWSAASITTEMPTNARKSSPTV